MKKFLNILALIGIMSYSGATVVSCGPKSNVSNNDDLEEDLSTIRQEFKSEIETIVQSYIYGSGVSSKLITSFEEANRNTFLNSTKIGEIMSGQNVEPFNYSLDNSTDYVDMKNDLNSAIFIESKLSELIEVQIRDQSRYSFLVSGIDRIFKNFGIANEVKITKQVVGDGDGADIYSINFDFWIEINFKNNGLVESDSTKEISLNFLLFESEEIARSIQSLLNGISSDMYKENTDFFTFDEEELEAKDSIFGVQSEGVENYFNDIQNKDTLENLLNEQIEDYSLDLIDGVEIGGISANHLDAQYNRSVMASSSMYSGDFIEKSLLMKSGYENDSDLKESFYSKYGWVSAFDSRFVTNAISNIGNYVSGGIQEDDFIEYGLISLENTRVKLSGDSYIDTNPIYLLYI